MGSSPPYIGLAAIFHTAVTTAAKVDRASGLALQAYVGTQFTWKLLSLAAEYDVARLNMFSIKIGVAF